MKGATDKTRVLVIDDSEIALQAIASVLEADGFQVFTVESAVGATNAIVKHDVHALVVDMNMPLMSGQKFGAMLRKNDRLTHVKLILVSGESEAELRRVGAQLGADAIVPKSQIAAQLASTVRRLTGRGAAGAAAPRGLRLDAPSRRRAVVADADRPFAEGLAARLAPLGFEVQVRVLGRGILAELLEATPSVVVVGEKLKDMPGASLIDLIDESSVARGVPVLYLWSENALISPFATRQGGPREILPRSATDEQLRDKLRLLVGDV